MPLGDELKFEHRAAQIVDLAVSALTTELSVTQNEAAKLLFVASGRMLTPLAIGEATRRLNASRQPPMIA
jgi:hypothetical protein